MTIVVATDFSPPARAATRLAAAVARRLQDKLLLVRVLEPAAAQFPELGGVNLDLIEGAMREAAQGHMERALAEVREMGVEAEGRLPVGVPDVVVPRLAADEQARFIVAGSHGRKALRRLLLGSVAERLVREAPCPVLVAREEGAAIEGWQGARPLRVVVGVDQSPASRAAVELVERLRGSVTCDVTFVHEYWPPAEYSRLGLPGPRDLFAEDPQVVDVLERELRAYHGFADGPGAAALRVRAAWGQRGDAVTRDAEAVGADLIVVGTAQAHGLSRLMRGSEATAALHGSKIPVLCVPARLASAAASRGGDAIPVVRSVLVTTDLSPLGDAAVPHACGLLIGARGRLHVLYVHEHGVPTPMHAFSPPGALSAEQRADLKRRLYAAVPAGAEAFGVDVEVEIVDGGSAAAAIVQAAERLGVDAVCLSSHGRSGIARTVLGSVAEQVLREVRRPLYVVRPRG